jgi:hypothetical protein
MALKFEISRLLVSSSLSRVCYFSTKLVIVFYTTKLRERSYIFTPIESSHRELSIDIKIIGRRRRRHQLHFNHNRDFMCESRTRCRYDRQQSTRNQHSGNTQRLYHSHGRMGTSAQLDGSTSDLNRGDVKEHSSTQAGSGLTPPLPLNQRPSASSPMTTPTRTS